MEHRALTVSVYLMNMTAWCAVFLFLCGATDEKINPVYAGLWIVGTYLWAVIVRSVKPGIVPLILLHMFSLSALAIQSRLIVKPENAWIVFSVLLLFGGLFGSLDRWRHGYAYVTYSFKWEFILLIMFVYVTGIFKKDSYMRSGSLAIGMVLILFHMWCTYLENLSDYFDEASDLRDQQKDEIISVTGKAARRTILVAAGCMTVSFLAARENILWKFIRLMGSLFNKIIAFINSLMKLPEGYGLEKRPEKIYPTAPPRENYSPEGDFQNRGFYIALLIISLIIIGIFTYRQLHTVHETSVYGRMSAWKKLRHDDEESKVDAAPAKRFHLFRDNNEKIRYMFRKRVKGHFKENVPKAYTAHEFENALISQEKEAPGIRELTECYDTARYSTHRITGKQLDSVKNALNGSVKE